MKFLLCAGNSIHFRHRNGCSWEGVKAFETENVSTWGGLEPPTFVFMPNALTYWAIRARHLLPHVVEYWLWRCRYLWGKVNIWNINCVWATAFIFDKQALIWNLKVRFMGVVIGQGNAVSTVSNWFTSFFCFASIWPTIHDIQLFEIWLWKNHCQDHGLGYIVHPAPNQCISFL